VVSTQSTWGVRSGVPVEADVWPVTPINFKFILRLRLF